MILLEDGDNFILDIAPPVPYNIDFALNIFAKNQDDALQIVEQILPTFNPQYTITILPFLEQYPDFKEDIPVIIQSVTFTDDYEGSYETRRTIMYTIAFQMKVSFYGPIGTQDIIRTTTANLFDMDRLGTDSDAFLEAVTVEPNPTSIFGMPDSDFGFSTTITGVE